MRDNLLTIQNVARILDVAEETVRREIRRGNLKGAKIGLRRIVVQKQDLIAYLQARGLDTTDLEQMWNKG